MDSIELLKQLADLATQPEPDPASVEVARLRFLECAKRGIYPEVIQRTTEMNPLAVAACHNYFSDFLDVLPHPNSGWIASLCVNVLLKNSRQSTLRRPRLFSRHAARIESLFQGPCKVEPALVHPAEIDVIPWHQWLDYIEKLFGSSPQPLPLQDSGEEPPGEGLFIPCSLVLHLWLTERDQEGAVLTTGGELQSILEILQEACGAEVDPITEPVLAHRGYSVLEHALVQIELMRWDPLTEEGHWVVKETIQENQTHLVLCQAGSNDIKGSISFGTSFTWVQFTRWSAIQEWLEGKTNVQMVQNMEMLQEFKADLAEVPRLNYTPDPAGPHTAIVGYTVLDGDQQVFDSKGNVPLALTSDQAAVIALAMEAGKKYAVAPVSLLDLYANAARGRAFIALREAYTRLQEVCSKGPLKGFAATLPAVPATYRWVQINSEQVLPKAQRPAFEKAWGAKL